MQELIAQFGPNTWLPFTAIAARMLLAAVLGAIVGFEREWRKRPAGLRTHVLVCLAAAVIAITTLELAHSPAFAPPLTRLDPVRTIEAVTSGVAFLAAGFIIFARGRVIGITTGAGLWLAGAIGLACGFGYWQIGGLATLLAVIVLCLLRTLEVRLEDKQPGSGADAKREREHMER